MGLVEVPIVKTLIQPNPELKIKNVLANNVPYASQD
jgi:hypothetical protein